jgi:hypothetical protein
MATMAPAPAHTPSLAAMFAGHAREIEQARRVHFGERLDDFEHVAARTEIAAGARDHDRLDAFVAGGGAKDVAELGVAFEGERIFALRAIERDRCDRALDRKLDMLRRVAG